jgi:hypothetical protein
MSLGFARKTFLDAVSRYQVLQILDICAVTVEVGKPLIVDHTLAYITAAPLSGDLFER